MLNSVNRPFPQCGLCCPGVARSRQFDLSIPAQRRTFKRKISKREYRSLCNQGESQGCCRYKSKNKNLSRRHCRLSVENCHASRSPRGQTSRRRSDQRRFSPQRSSIYSGAIWRTPCFQKEVPPASSLQAPHVERKITVITIDDDAATSDDCLVEDVQPEPVCHISEQPNGGTETSSENITHPTQPLPAGPVCFPEVNASRQGQDLSSSPLFTIIESLGVPQLGIPSSPLNKPSQVLPQE